MSNRFGLFYEVEPGTHQNVSPLIDVANEQEGEQGLTMTETEPIEETHIPTPAEVFVQAPQEDGRFYVTPAVAAAWLRNYNFHNRPTKKKRVLQYTRDMLSGKWQYDGAPIRFGMDPERGECLLDGQNRLAAVVASGRAQWFLVVTGLEMSAQNVMDQGAPRSLADNLGLAGEKNRMVLSAASRVGVLMDQDRNGAVLNNGNFTVTTSEQMEWIESHPDIRAFVDHVAAQKTRWRPFPQGLVAYAMWRLSQIDPVEADRFFTDWREKRTQGRGDPVFTLIDRIESYTAKNERRMTTSEYLHLIFRVWNARQKGETMARLQRSTTVPVPVAVRQS